MSALRPPALAIILDRISPLCSHAVMVGAGILKLMWAQARAQAVCATTRLDITLKWVDIQTCIITC
jgi:hypothetical protein